MYLSQLKVRDYQLYKNDELNATALLWTATVMRNRGDISNRIDSNTECSQCTHRRFTTWAWTFNFNIKVFDALLNSSTTSNF